MDGENSLLVYVYLTLHNTSTWGHTWVLQRKYEAEISHCGTRFALPGDLCFIIKNIVRNVHAVLVVPSLTSHSAIYHLPQGSGRSSEGLLTGCAWCRQSYAHQPLGSEKGYISLSNLPSAALLTCDCTWVITTANVICKMLWQGLHNRSHLTASQRPLSWL